MLDKNIGNHYTTTPCYHNNITNNYNVLINHLTLMHSPIDPFFSPRTRLGYYRDPNTNTPYYFHKQLYVTIYYSKTP